MKRQRLGPAKKPDFQRKFEEKRDDEIPPRQSDTPFIVAARQKNIKGSVNFCSHPSCMIDRRECHYRDANISLCRNHAPNEDLGHTMLLKFNGGDLVPFAKRGIMRNCSEFSKAFMDTTYRHFIFVCNECGGVCAFCAKKCYESGHNLMHCRYGMGFCTKNRLVKIERKYTYSYVQNGDDEIKKFEIEF